MKHLHAEIKSNLIEVFEVGVEVDSFEFWESGLEIRQII